jgi:translation initiation factor 2B subunit (eIF-2B alpha/beta/delta family)
MSTIEAIEQRIAQIRNDREHGSRWLVRETIRILQDLAQSLNSSEGSTDEQMQILKQVGRELAQARPAMAAIGSAVGRIVTVQGGLSAVVQAAASLLQDYDTSTARIAASAQLVLKGRIMTCSVSGTVLEVLARCRKNVEEVIVLEGRPRYEGRAMAEQLVQQGITVTLITDAQADIFLPLCQSVVVGADSILANGDVLNKSGTALLGWAAQRHKVPFYVLCETLKISPRRWLEDAAAHWAENTALLEEKEPEEVLEQPIAGVKVRNFYFDHTPSQCVTQVITEHGVLRSQEIAEIAQQVQANEKLLST